VTSVVAETDTRKMENFENLSPEEKARLKKASSDRLRLWLSRAGIVWDEISKLNRQQLLERAAVLERPNFDEVEIDLTDPFEGGREEVWEMDLALRRKELALREQERLERQFEREERAVAQRRKLEAETERFNYEMRIREQEIERASLRDQILARRAESQGVRLKELSETLRFVLPKFSEN